MRFQSIGFFGCFWFWGFLFTFNAVYTFLWFKLEAQPIYSVQVWSMEVEVQKVSELHWGSLPLLQGKGGLQGSSASECFPAAFSLPGVCSFSISRLLRILRSFLFPLEQGNFKTGPPHPLHLMSSLPLTSSHVSCRFMTAWTATAVDFNPIPPSPAWRRCSMRSAETQRSWSWCTSWYVPPGPRGCSGVKMKVPGRCF